MKNVKDKVTGLVFAFGMATLPVLWPQNISKAQLSGSSPEKASNQIVDSLNAEKNKIIDSALQIASSLPKMSTTLTRYMLENNKPRIIKKFVKPQVVLRYHGEVFEADAEYYKGYLIVDCDKALHRFDSVITIPIDSVQKPASAPKRNWLQRLFRIK